MGSRKKSKGKTSRSKSKRCKRNQSISAASLSRASLAKGSMCKGAMAQGLSMGPGAGGPAPAGTFAEQSQQAMCPQCAIMVQTQTTPTVGICTYALCVVTIPCCWIPFLTDCSKDIEHRCPTCGYYFGKHQRLNI